MVQSVEHHINLLIDRITASHIYRRRARPFVIITCWQNGLKRFPIFPNDIRELANIMAVAVVMMENNLSLCNLFQNRKWRFTTVDLLSMICYGKDLATKAREELDLLGKKVMCFIKQDRLIDSVSCSSFTSRIVRSTSARRFLAKPSTLGRRTPYSMRRLAQNACDVVTSCEVKSYREAPEAMNSFNARVNKNDFYVWPTCEREVLST